MLWLLVICQVYSSQSFIWHPSPFLKIPTIFTFSKLFQIRNVFLYSVQFKLFIRSFHLYKYKIIEKTGYSTRCLIGRELLPFLLVLKYMLLLVSFIKNHINILTTTMMWAGISFRKLFFTSFWYIVQNA